MSAKWVNPVTEGRAKHKGNNLGLNDNRLKEWPSKAHTWRNSPIRNSSSPIRNISSKYSHLELKYRELFGGRNTRENDKNKTNKGITEFSLAKLLLDLISGKPLSSLLWFLRSFIPIWKHALKVEPSVREKTTHLHRNANLFYKVLGFDTWG